MKKNYFAFALLFSLFFYESGWSQCATTTTLGSASNIFTKVINSNNSIAADKDLNTIVFIHRNNASLNGGNSGQLRFDVSTNGGTSWTTNQGILNPLNTSLARYPNVAIYNPSLNTTPSNAYLSYMAPTINGSSVWNGNVSGVRQLNNTGNTEAYNQPAGPLAYIPRSLTKGAPGVFWAIDAQWGTGVSGFNVYKGTWNSSINDIQWVTNFTVTPPFNNGYFGGVYVGIDHNIAFDPTGTIGWFSFLGHVTPGPTPYAYYPVFYKTTDGGTTWTGPITADLNTFSCMTSNLGSGMPSANQEHDLVVDVYGNPHFITTIVDGNNTYGANYSGWHHMYDITCVNGIWTGNDIASVNAAPYTFGVSPNFVTQYQAPQAARTQDGSKVFFTWVDNSATSLGGVNSAPNLFGRAYDVVTKQWTNVKDFTSCNVPVAGKIFFPHIANEVLEPSGTTFKLATAYGQLTANDPGLVADFVFLDNVTFTLSEFSVPQPSANVSVAQGSLALACLSGSTNLSLSGTYDAVSWSNGVTTVVNPVNTPGIYTVTAISNCNIGTTTVAVAMVSSTVALPVAPAVCEGLPITLTVTGNSTSHQWLPSNTVDPTLTVIPTLSSTYSIEIFGNGCSDIMSIPMNITPSPSLTVSGSNTVCNGSSVSQTVSGASTYVWVNVGTGNVIALSPTVNTAYVVVGTDANSCIGTKTITISVVARPNITAVPVKSTICPGETTSLTVNAGGTYTLTGPNINTVHNNPLAAVSPTTTTTFTVINQNNAGCYGTAMITITVAACTGIDAINQSANTAIFVYPNPSNGEFTLSTDTDVTLNITNELGQMVKTVSLNANNNHQLSLSGFAKGIYFISGRSGDKIIAQKIIVAD